MWVGLTLFGLDLAMSQPQWAIAWLRSSKVELGVKKEGRFHSAQTNPSCLSDHCWNTVSLPLPGDCKFNQTFHRDPPPTSAPVCFKAQVDVAENHGLQVNMLKGTDLYGRVGLMRPAHPRGLATGTGWTMREQGPGLWGKREGALPVESVGCFLCMWMLFWYKLCA